MVGAAFVAAQGVAETITRALVVRGLVDQHGLTRKGMAADVPVNATCVERTCATDTD